MPCRRVPSGLRYSSYRSALPLPLSPPRSTTTGRLDASPLVASGRRETSRRVSRVKLKSAGCGVYTVFCTVWCIWLGYLLSRSTVFAPEYTCALYGVVPGTQPCLQGTMNRVSARPRTGDGTHGSRRGYIVPVGAPLFTPSSCYRPRRAGADRTLASERCVPLPTPAPPMA